MRPLLEPWMRDAAEELLPDVATIERKQSVPSGAGGTRTGWEPIAGDVACAIAPLGGGEADSGERLSEQSTAVVTLPAGQDVTEADRIIIGELTYNVTLVRRRESWEIVRRVEVTRDT